MKLGRRAVTTLLISLIGVITASITVSFAWFATNHGNFKENTTGSVLDSYFDYRTYDVDKGQPHGSAANPYVITTPRHYENLVKLYTQDIYDPETKSYVNFSKKYFYFDIGKKFEDGETSPYLVHEYDSIGVDTGNLVSTLNLSSVKPFEPIGNDPHLLNCSINGHDLTVANFTVKPNTNETGQSYNDVGIFGLVNAASRCSNIYWKTFTIDASGAIAGEHTDTSAATKHNDNVRIGYIAGHIITYESFVNCYVNDCKIISPKMTSVLRDDYGYYGMCENDKTGSALPGGKNYSFKLDSEAWHTYFNTNYSALKSQQSLYRNTIEAEPAGGEIEPVNGKLSDAIIPGDVANSYWINGKTNTNSGSYSGLNYSLSTTGYVGGERTVQKKEDLPVTYLDGSSYKDVSNSPTLSNYSATTNFEPTEQGSWHYGWDTTDNKWTYYNVYNHKTVAGDKFAMHLDFNGSSEYCGPSEKTPYSTSVRIYLDDATDVNDYDYIINGTGKVDGWEIRWEIPDTTLYIPFGKHVGCILWYRHFKYRNTTHEYYSCLEGTKSSSTCTFVDIHSDFKYRAITSGHEIYVSNYGEWDLDEYESTLNHCWSNGTKPSFSGKKSFNPADWVGTGVLGDSNKVYDLYYTYNGSKVQLKNTDENTYNNASFTIKNGLLKVTIYVVVIDEKTKTRKYFDEEDEIVATNYKHENIDIVGGGVGFYYYNLGPLGQYRITRIQSEGKTASATVVKKITTDDVGKKFYAPGRVNQSIVLYIKNVGSALDQVDDDFGTIKNFVYYQISTRTVHPSFKKGATSSSVDYIDLEDTSIFGTPEDKGTARKGWTDKKLSESLVQKACYCCLDSQGRILGTYNSDGSYGAGMNDEQAAKIDTYVLAIGSFTNADYANWHLWIDEIEFDYKAANGEGGTFGSVGYRDSAQKITDTILNFYIETIPTNTQFMIKVNFQSSSSTYVISIKSTKQLVIVFYNYYNETYSLNINGTSYTTVKSEVVVPATSTYYPDFPDPT